MLMADHARMRKAGCAIAEAAMYVVREHDGLHRLSLATAEWAKAIADEGGRARSTVTTQPSPISDASSGRLGDGERGDRDEALNPLTFDEPGSKGGLWRHVKSDGEYEIVGNAYLQTKNPTGDMTPLVVYRGESGLWARPGIEFHDGRFERVLPTPGPEPSPLIELPGMVITRLPHGVWCERTEGGLVPANEVCVAMLDEIVRLRAAVLSVASPDQPQAAPDAREVLDSVRQQLGMLKTSTSTEVFRGALKVAKEAAALSDQQPRDERVEAFPDVTEVIAAQTAGMPTRTMAEFRASHGLRRPDQNREDLCDALDAAEAKLAEAEKKAEQWRWTAHESATASDKIAVELAEAQKTIANLQAPITMQDIRLHVEEGPLLALDVFYAANAVLRSRARTPNQAATPDTTAPSAAGREEP
jgi:hypothetical protein